MKLVYFLVTIVFLTSCLSEPNLENKVKTTQTIFTLDSIFGDKLITENQDEIRQNNFLYFLKITKENLVDNSALYNVTPIGPDFYIVNQKQTYSKARSFSALLKIKEEIVSKYEIVNDFQIIDQLNDLKGLFILFGNFGNYSKYWKTNNEIQLIRFDNSLNQLWVYAPLSTQFPLEAIEIKSKNDYTIVTVNVITGCHICTNTFELKIDSLGNCFSAIEIHKTNSTVSLDKQTVTEIFKIPITKNKNH